MEQNDKITNETVKRARGRPKIPDALKKPQQSRQQYFNDYYHNKKLSEPINCELCNSVITRMKMTRHQATKKCIKKRCITSMQMTDPPIEKDS
jgi:hypothetical protein